MAMVTVPRSDKFDSCDAGSIAYAIGSIVFSNVALFQDTHTEVEGGIEMSSRLWEVTEKAANLCAELIDFESDFFQNGPFAYEHLDGTGPDDLCYKLAHQCVGEGDDVEAVFREHAQLNNWPLTDELINVAFRMFPGGDVIALWGTPDRKGVISSYMHVGQHGDASPDLIDELSPALPEQYESLKAELTSIGYNVQVQA